MSLASGSQCFDVCKIVLFVERGGASKYKGVWLVMQQLKHQTPHVGRNCCAVLANGGGVKHKIQVQSCQVRECIS